MDILTVIQRVKAYCNGKDIDDTTSRDQILYGNPHQPCTGIVTTCWASVEVIRKAHAQGANLIICHEALFWNHGDHTEWLEENKNQTFLKKRQLLEDTGIVVWRCHDYIHAGIPINGQYTDGIFYGFAKQLGWESYIIQDLHQPLFYDIPKSDVKTIAKQMLNCFHLDGMRILGDINAEIEHVFICAHVMGRGDNELITRVDHEGIDLLITLELIDYTASEYIRDSSMLGAGKAILSMGHFNAEEPGMEYMAAYLPEAIQDHVPCSYIQSGDMYHYITK